MAEGQERPSVRRRSSIGRAFERVRDAMKRRRSSAAAVTTLQSTREEGATATSPLAVEEPASESTAAKQNDRIENRPAEPHESTADSQLIPDDELVEDDPDTNEEPLTPSFPSRSGISEEKAKALFERYGIRYQPRGPDGGLASKIRRVERPVRIRIHWTCHECDRQFGHDRSCMNCGHRRCEDCLRAPPKKVKAIVDQAKTAASKDQILAAIEPNTVAVVAPETSSGDDLLVVDDGKDVDISQYTMQARPRAGIKLVMRQKAPRMRRVCHECKTPFGTKNRKQCEECGHQRCDACPSRTAKPAEDEEAPFEPSMVATVQRVYRKPRQRVRWQCDKCQTTLADGHVCRECGHERCSACVRSPGKRPPHEPDPAVLKSLNDKIEAWQWQRSQAPENTTTQLKPKPDLS